ncbi:MAG: IS3 family transposase [Desulfobacula sp.]|nr:IS3 family transposase [Desulfobacula sp.]
MNNQFIKFYNFNRLSFPGQGNCLDNAPAESFFHTLKVEEVYGQSYETRGEAKSKLFKYVFGGWFCVSKTD